MKFLRLDDIAEESVSHNPQVKKRVMLRKGDVPHLTVFARAVFPPGEIAVSHAHADMSEVFFVESGKGHISVNGKEYSLEKASCVAVLPGEAHELANSSKEDLVIVYFGISA
ncbi:MAG TPA: cupin domain-containing protein [Thermodesulfovibrionales bacterium]|nr:cupin domain-containing protein [Thermodesulfovibrionales bacterium]